MSELEPITREEQYLNAIAGGDNAVPEPITREEKFLNAILENGGGGGLPVVTQQDDGKVLTVVNGQWMADSSAPLVDISYANLVALRDAGKLVAGMQYRITDYETIIIGSYNLSALGAEGYIHYARSTEESWFDIIVTADDESHLNENARAARSDGVTYAPDAKPEAWELKYSLDNDSTRFAWANSTHGKGVIYYMRDEHNNSAGYDFKSIQFLRYALKLADATADYTPSDTGLVYDASTQPNRYGSPYRIFTALQSYMTSGTYVNPFPMNYKGQTAYNYDFLVGYNILGAIQFPEADDTYLSTFGADWYYTFDYYKDGEHYDISSVGFEGINTRCYGNELFPDVDALASQLDPSTKLRGLGGTCFENNYVGKEDHSGCALNNHFSSASPFNTFGGNCTRNNFGSGCFDIIMGDGCYSNNFGGSCYSNNFGADCFGNFFGYECNNNYFADWCRFITLDDKTEEVSIPSSYSRTHFNRGCIRIDLSQHPTMAHEVVTYNGSSGEATAINRIDYNTETALSTTDGGATWA